MNSFYFPNISEKSIQLTEEESRHCIKVLRLRKGDRVQLLNGKGSVFEAAIQVPDARRCILAVLEEKKILKSNNYLLTIAIAPTKNIDRFEWFIEKSTEIGIDRIIPIICQHSERKDIKFERLEKILVSAVKQSGQAFLPELTSAISFKEMVNMPFIGQKFIAHCEPGEKHSLKNSLIPGSNTLILIGPEGDFDTDEIILSKRHGYVPVSLGESRLRTETAGLVACHTVSLLNEK